MLWYVLHVETSFEQKVVDEIHHLWMTNEVRSFVPRYEANFRKAGVVTLETRRLFPGYVFVETKMKGTELIVATRGHIERSAHIHRFLRYGDGHEGCCYAMNAEERRVLKNLCGDGYCIGMSRGVIEDGETRVFDGPLIGHESLIKHIDRHKMVAILEVEKMGQKREMKVGLEIVSKT